MPPEAPVIRTVKEGAFIPGVKSRSRCKETAEAQRACALGGAGGTLPRQTPGRRRYSESEPLPGPIFQFGPVHLHAISQCFWSRHIVATVRCAQGGRVTLWHLE